MAILRHHIIVDREQHILTLYKRGYLNPEYHEQARYPIAVGMIGHRTPRGMYIIDDRDRTPSWTIPYGVDWVPEHLWGVRLPYGDPNNPIKGRWMGLKDAEGVGIHGTADETSIGEDASHGCIRMYVQDVIDLYPNARLGTSVYII